MKHSPRHQAPRPNSCWSRPRSPDGWRKFIFLLDPRGRIRFFSGPEPFSADDTALIGQPIRRLVPTLPLRDHTPGYNIAFASFYFPDEDWRTYAVRMADGSLRDAEIRIRPVALEGGRCLLGIMRFKPACAIGVAATPAA